MGTESLWNCSVEFKLNNAGMQTTGICQRRQSIDPASLEPHFSFKDKNKIHFPTHFQFFFKKRRKRKNSPIENVYKEELTEYGALLVYAACKQKLLFCCIIGNEALLLTLVFSLAFTF